MTCKGPGNQREPCEREEEEQHQARRQGRARRCCGVPGPWDMGLPQSAGNLLEFCLLAFGGKQPTDLSSVELIPDFGSQYL